jgi:uncharacterized repeat protein (TIGR01451 family)
MNEYINHPFNSPKHHLTPFIIGSSLKIRIVEFCLYLQHLNLPAMKKWILLIALFCAQFSLHAQLISWATANNNSCERVITDALGNIYKIGGSDNVLTGYSLEKFSANGNLLWEVNDAGTATGGTTLTNIALAPNGDIYVTAILRPGSHIGVDSIAVSGIADAALVKYNNLGQLQWYKILTGATGDSENFTSVHVTSTGNVVALGWYNNQVVFGGQTVNSPGYHMFWGIFDANGNNISLNHRTATSNFVNAAKMDASDNLFIATYCTTTNLKTVYKMDLAGNLLWTWEAGAGPGSYYSLALDNTGAVFLTGEHSGAAIYNGVTYTPVGGADVILTKLNPNGSFSWFKQLGSTSAEIGLGIAADNNCNIYITGYYNVNSDFDGITLASMGGGNDIFFASLDSTGSTRWATNGGGSTNDAGYCMTYDAWGDRMISGGYIGTAAGSTFGSYSFLGGNKGYLVSFTDEACQVKGRVFRDNNNNGTEDAGDENFPNIMVGVAPGNLWTNSAYSGNYNVYTGLGTFTMSLPNIPNYFVQTGATTHSATFTAFGQIDSGNDFGLYPTANINDLQITLTSFSNNVRANTTEGYLLTYRNAGTTNITGAEVTFTFDPQLSFALSLPVANTINSGSATWILPILYMGDVGTIIVYLDVPAIAIGTLLTFTGEITHAQVEQTPADNISTIQRVVVNSLDPNEKEVSPAGDVTPQQVSAGLELDYTIRFQNTGNDTAYFVRLVDTLSNNLDLGTFQWVSESHPSIWHINESRVLVVDFENINLVDSFANEPMSHGFFRYKVSAINSLVHGEQIENTAYIYFDFNPAIVTNTTLTNVNDPNSVFAPSGESQLVVYPVPAQNEVFFQWKSTESREGEITLLDAYGKVCASAACDGNGASMNLNQLSSGMYFYRLMENGMIVETGKIIVQK